jgi:hypothetical protein
MLMPLRLLTRGQKKTKENIYIMSKMLGKIESIKLGYGGYQDAMFGLTVVFSLEGGSSGCTDFKGWWCDSPSENAKWTVEDKNKIIVDVHEKIIEMCEQANVNSLDELVGTPVEVVFDRSYKFPSWRILIEVL